MLNINEDSGIVDIITALMKIYNESIDKLEVSLVECNPSQESQIILLMEECGSRLGRLSNLYSHLRGCSQCCSLDGHSVNVLCGDEDYVCIQKYSKDVENSDTDAVLWPSNKDEENTIPDQTLPEIDAPVLENKKTSINGEESVNICGKSHVVRLASLSLETADDNKKQQYQGHRCQKVESMSGKMLVSTWWHSGGSGAQFRTCFDPGGPGLKVDNKWCYIECD